MAEKKYITKELLPKKHFDKASLKTIELSKQGSKGVIGCRQGFYNSRSNTCRIGTELHKILIPADAHQDKKIFKNPLDILNYKSSISNIRINKGELIGQGTEIVYEYMGKLYKHKFSSRPAIYGGKGYILLIDKNLYTDERGIHN